MRSLAAYSVVMYLLLLRDRHNGNLMLDEEGHYFHIDFGFCLGHSTGKGIGGMVESSPFKLTPEYIDVLDGVGSPVYERYCDACVAAIGAPATERTWSSRRCAASTAWRRRRRRRRRAADPSPSSSSTSASAASASAM